MYQDYYDVETVTTDVNAIKQSIQNILMTPKGSLPGKPTFGSDLYRLVFAQLDELTKSIARNYAEEALKIWEDRIEIDSIVISRSDAYHKLIIDVNFTYTSDVTAEDETIDTVTVSI